MVNVTCVVPQLQIKILRGKKSLVAPHCSARSVCGGNKGFVSGNEHSQMAAPQAPLLFPSKVGFLPLALCSETQAGAGENLFISSTNRVCLPDTHYFSQGLFPCDSAFWVLFLLLRQMGNRDLFSPYQDGASVSCFPSSGDR